MSTIPHNTTPSIPQPYHATPRPPCHTIPYHATLSIHHKTPHHLYHTTPHHVLYTTPTPSEPRHACPLHKTSITFAFYANPRPPLHVTPRLSLHALRTFYTPSRPAHLASFTYSLTRPRYTLVPRQPTPFCKRPMHFQHATTPSPPRLSLHALLIFNPLPTHPHAHIRHAFFCTLLTH